jgi:ABC-2 type transport system permease protein
MYILNLIKATLIKDIKYLRRYKFNTVFNILLLCFIFIGLSSGYKPYSAEINIGSIEKLLSGYIVWLIMVSSFTGIVNNLINETNLGTLEQLYISSKSFYLTLIIKGISSLIITIFQILIIILIIIVVSPNISISFLFSFLRGIPFLLLGIPSIWGISLLICSFALQHKNIGSIYNAISSILFAAISYGVHTSKILAILFPFGLANISLQNIYNANQFPYTLDLLLIVSNSIFYIMAGIMMFKFYESKAKISGKFAKH